MKKCDYCGRESQDDRTHCSECGTEFPIPGPPSLPQPQKTLRWFKIYTGVLCFGYLAVIAFGLSLIFDDPAEGTSGIVLVFIGIVSFIGCLLPLILQPRPWLWTYNLVIICLGMTSAFFLPAAIPLLIAWMKPETKSLFGKTGTGAVIPKAL